MYNKSHIERFLGAVTFITPATAEGIRERANRVVYKTGERAARGSFAACALVTVLGDEDLLATFRHLWETHPQVIWH